MKRFIFILSLFTFTHLQAQDRPNILWLVCEDMSPYLSSYGNTAIKTPNLDALAAKGIRFTQAHSNGPQCSPSRSTLVSGIYAVSLGTDIHREKRPVPDTFYFPAYLRKEGYYTTNNHKQDYNNLKTPAAVWNESSRKASYLDRENKKQPFFAVFNSGITHMSRVATRTVEGRTLRTVEMQDVEVPAYVPDLPDVRDDIAWNMDAVKLMDKWVGEKLDELKKSGEADNTIIFFYSDHGGTVPRGKAYVYESGTHVPFIAYFPEKWKHLANTAQPAVSNRLVSFVDFGPTVLNLTGTTIPAFMAGKPFFGKGADKAGNINKYLFAFRANQGDSYTPARAVTNGKYKLIWNYQSAYPNGTRQDYQWQMPAQQAWDIANRKDQLNPLQEKFWKPVETFELYDLQTDSLETNNLAYKKDYSKIFNELKQVLQQTVREQKDLGFIPREYRKTLQSKDALYNLAQAGKIDYLKHISAAETASLKTPEDLKTLISYLSDSDPVVQYWGASGICGLAKSGLIKSIPKEAEKTMQQDTVIPEVKCMLAEAMVYTGQEQKGLQYLLSQLKEGFGPAAAALQNTGAKAKPIVTELQSLLEGKTKNKHKFYIRSILINCGALPYTALYEANEKVSD